MFQRAMNSGGGTPFMGGITLDDLNETSKVTDANPLVIKCDLSKYNHVVPGGAYYPNDSSNFKKYYNEYSFDFGTKFRVCVGSDSTENMKGWRNITVYQDRVEIGQGYYGASSSSLTADSRYGVLRFLAFYH